MIFSKTPKTAAPRGSKIGSWTSNTTKSEHLPIGNSPHFVTYTPPSHNPPNTQTLPTVSTTKDLGIVLNTRLSDEDNVVSAANKARRMLFYLIRPFAALTPSIFLPLYKTFIRPHLEYAIQATHPILCRDAEALEKVQKLALKFGMSRTKQPSNSFVYSPSHTDESVGT